MSKDKDTVYLVVGIGLVDWERFQVLAIYNNKEAAFEHKDNVEKLNDLMDRYRRVEVQPWQLHTKTIQ